MDYQIEIQPAGVKYLTSSQNTLLDAALANKIFLEHSCKKGECGLCAANVLSGLVKNEQGTLVSSGNILTCCSYPQSDLTLKAGFCPELAHIECVTMPCKVMSYELVADDIAILTLRLPPSTSFHYLPGQYIDLIYKGIRRSYSVANIQETLTGIELHIRLLPDGEFSQSLLDVTAGQLMRLEGPKGTFFVRNATNPILFLAGGTGFAPIKAMVESLLTGEMKRELYIYWGMTHAKRFYTDLAKRWEEIHASVHYIPVVSSVDAEWLGRRGLVHHAVIEDFPDLKEYHVYACGSPLMIDEAKKTFISHGLAEDNFFADSFVSSK